GVETLDRRHDLAARKDLDPEPPSARFVNELREPLGRPEKLVQDGWISGGQSPLDLGLGDDVGRIADDGGSRDHDAAGLRQEPPPSGVHAALLTRRRADGRRLRRRGPRGPPVPGISRTTRAPSGPWESSGTLP